MTIETQNEGLIRSQALKMNKREVPYYFDSFVSNTTKELRYGSMIFGKNPICPHTTNLSEFIARQVLCRPGLYLKHEPNVKILLLDIKMMVSPTQLTVPSAAPIPLSLSANPNQLKTEKLEKQFAPLWRDLADKLKVLVPDGDDQGAFIIPALHTRSHVLRIKD